MSAGGLAAPASGLVPSAARASGLVLCGGASRRMGADKALLALGERTLLERAIACLAPHASPVRLACGERERYGALGFELVCDRRASAGPLAGLEAGLAAASGSGPSETDRSETDAGEYVCVLAVDMPRVDAELVARLLAHARANDLDACLLASAGGIEPLCAVYHTRLLPRVRAALDAGERKVTSFFAADFGAEVARVAYLDAGASGAELNLNTPAELERERAALPRERKAAS